MFDIISGVTSPKPTLSCPIGQPAPATKPLRKIPPLWMMVVAQLDTRQFDFTPEQLAPLLSIQPHSLRNHCRAIWPDHEGQWFLDFDEAVVLIYCVCLHSARARQAEELWRQLSSTGVIDQGLENREVIKRAAGVIGSNRNVRCPQRRARFYANASAKH